MVKLSVALDSLTKSQLFEIAKATQISVSQSKPKPEIIEHLSVELSSQQRLERVTRGFDEKDICVIKMFLNQKKVRYDGMSQGEFARFLQNNMRMANSFATCIHKLSTLGFIFTSVKIKEKDDPKVVFPSEYLRFFDDYLKLKQCP
nr:hypothetical protein [Candidatus Sigynarchaeota archaeon]